MSRATLTLLLSILLGALAVVASGIANPELIRITTEMLISVILVVGLYIFIGNSGVLSFGHLGFVAVGAYVTAWFSMSPDIKSASLTALPSWILGSELSGPYAIVIAAASAALVAVIVGAFVMRLTGVAASIATFAFLAVMYAFASNWTDGTGGTASLVGIPGFATLPLVTVVAVSTVLIAAMFDGSRQGIMLRATREDNVASLAIGLGSYKVRLLAFILSAAVVGVAGSLDASFLGVVSPDAYFIPATFGALAMLVLGGMQSLEGAVFGTIVLTIAREALLKLEDGVTLLSFSIHIPRGMQELAVAVLICSTLVFRPRGLMSGITELLRVRSRKERLAKSSATSEDTQQQPPDGSRT
jgi:branched-chain amino acid transport system permease protein